MVNYLCGVLTIKLVVLFYKAEQYKATHISAKDYEVCEVDPRNHCLSETSCDDCSWGEPCPRHPN